MRIVIEKSEIAGFLNLSSKIYVTMSEVFALYSGKTSEAKPLKKTAEDAMNAMSSGNTALNQDNLSIVRDFDTVTITVSPDYVLRHFAWVERYYEALAEIATMAVPVLLFAKNKLFKLMDDMTELQRDAQN